MCTATAPDVCKTPAPPAPFVPTPYPNTAQCVQMTEFSGKVKIVSRNAVHKSSKIPMSMGDQPGVIGGVVSGVVMNQVKYLQGSSKVKVEGKPFVFHTAQTGHNGSSTNIIGLQSAPSQVKVLVVR
jgi:hypothetical protein